MTTRELDQLRYLKIEVRHYEEKLCEIELLRNDRMTTSHLNRQQRKEYVAAVDELEWILQEELEKQRRELERLQAFVDGIADPFIKDLIRLRFVEGMSLRTIPAWVVKWGWYTEDGVKQTIYRFLKKSESAAKDAAA